MDDMLDYIWTYYIIIMASSMFGPSLQRRILGIHRESPWLVAVANDLSLAREGALHD